MKTSQILKVQILPDGAVITTTGREAWALRSMINAGSRGVTPIDHPGPRWSSYVFDLKKMGLDIETLHEKHGGDFPGHHARYVLRTPVQIIEDTKLAA